MLTLHILVAYPYLHAPTIKALERLRQVCDVQLMLDSGAFTAWRSGQAVDFDQYCALLLDPPLSIQHAVQLDVVGDHEATLRNYERMLEKGLNVLPVFTRGAPLAHLNRFYSVTDYIMFGGIVSSPGNREYLKWFMQHNGTRKVHWLGFTNHSFVSAYRPYSTDSSSWNFSMRSGKMRLYTGSGILREFCREDIARGGVLLEALLAQHKLPIGLRRKLRTESGWRGGKAASFRASTVANILRAQDTYRTLGTRMYLAASNAPQIDMLRAAVELLSQS